MALLLNKLKPPFTQECFVSILLEINPPVLEKTSFTFVLFHYYLPLEMREAICVATHLKNLESTSSKDALCQVWLNLVR